MKGARHPTEAGQDREHFTALNFNAQLESSEIDGLRPPRLCHLLFSFDHPHQTYCRWLRYIGFDNHFYGLAVKLDLLGHRSIEQK